jgi:hypothetical protein
LLKLKENTLVQHPDGGYIFGTIPDMPKFGLPGGKIYLRVGIHRRANSADLLKHGCQTADGVAAIVAKMIVPGAQIYCEFKEQRCGNRVAVLRTSMGTLILEPRHERATGFGYFVVTWYPQKRAHGTLVGQIPRAPPNQK